MRKRFHFALAGMLILSVCNTLDFAGSDTYRMFVCTDVHIDAATEKLDRFVEIVLSDHDHIPATLCLGDLQYGKGNLHLFAEHIKPPQESPRDTLLTVPGNHDITFGLWDEYLKYFGTGTYYFYVKTPDGNKDIFLCLDSASGTIGSSQREWAESILQNNKECRHRIICTHTHFFPQNEITQGVGNYTMEETHELLGMFSRSGVDYVMTGHDHAENETICKGITFHVFPSMKQTDANPMYSIVTFGADGKISVDSQIL